MISRKNSIELDEDFYETISELIQSTSTPPAARKNSRRELIQRSLSHQSHGSSSLSFLLIQFGFGLLILGSAILIVYLQSKRHVKTENFVKTNINEFLNEESTTVCAKSCRIQLVESIPQNLTFDNSNAVQSLKTSDVWKKLINDAKHSLTIAAYKSSLRGIHVFGDLKQNYSKEGEMIYDALLNAGLNRHINIRIVENGLSKDKGDNEDGSCLERRGAIRRRQLNMPKKNFFNAGVMHSKFIVADGKHFYLGSANLDWRSLNQKLEMGIYVTDCPCLAQDLNSVFDVYWRLANVKSGFETESILRHLTAIKFNANKPLKLADGTYWPTIDNAIRSAILRGVEVKIIAAALHNPMMGLKFLKSLEGAPGTGTINIKIFKVPSSNTTQSVIRRDRRTHKKFLVTDDTVIIGTSNWSGDYFEARGTGVAVVIRQDNPYSNRIVTQMRSIFNREYDSRFTHSLDKYINNCLVLSNYKQLKDFCEPEKDKALLINQTNGTVITVK